MQHQNHLIHLQKQCTCLYLTNVGYYSLKFSDRKVLNYKDLKTLSLPILIHTEDTLSNARHKSRPKENQETYGIQSVRKWHWGWSPRTLISDVTKKETVVRRRRNAKIALHDLIWSVHSAVTQILNCTRTELHKAEYFPFELFKLL